MIEDTTNMRISLVLLGLLVLFSNLTAVIFKLFTLFEIDFGLSFRDIV